MTSRWIRCLVATLALAAAVPSLRAADEPASTRKEDVIYGRKFGTALTMDVFSPRQNANGAAVILVVSGGWFSSHDGVNPGLASVFLKRGYTVFAVVHGSQPRFTIPDAVGDLNRAVRFIRSHAKDYSIDPDRIGITGGSAGGHLSLMQGTAGDAGNPKATDPVERVSSRVQAVACFFPPTDFLNWGEQGKDIFQSDLMDRLRLHSPFDFQDFDKEKNRFVTVTDPKRVHEILRKVSPIAHVTAESPPMLIIHGDKDALVPVQQAEVMAAKLKEAGVPVELIVKPGADHGWQGMDKDVATMADWFDKHLKKKE